MLAVIVPACHSPSSLHNLGTGNTLRRVQHPFQAPPSKVHWGQTDCGQGPSEVHCSETGDRSATGEGGHRGGTGLRPASRVLFNLVLPCSKEGQQVSPHPRPQIVEQIHKGPLLLHAADIGGPSGCLGWRLVHEYRLHRCLFLRADCTQTLAYLLCDSRSGCAQTMPSDSCDPSPLTTTGEQHRQPHLGHPAHFQGFLSGEIFYLFFLWMGSPSYSLLVAFAFTRQ